MSIFSFDTKDCSVEYVFALPVRQIDNFQSTDLTSFWKRSFFRLYDFFVIVYQSSCIKIVSSMPRMNPPADSVVEAMKTLSGS